LVWIYQTMYTKQGLLPYLKLGKTHKITCTEIENQRSKGIDFIPFTILTKSRSVKGVELSGFHVRQYTSSQKLAQILVAPLRIHPIFSCRNTFGLFAESIPLKFPISYHQPLSSIKYFETIFDLSDWKEK